MKFPTTPGDSFTYRGETFWVISYDPKRRVLIAETADCQRKAFHN
jgi:hypothetical protein